MADTKKFAHVLQYCNFCRKQNVRDRSVYGTVQQSVISRTRPCTVHGHKYLTHATKRGESSLQWGRASLLIIIK